jgi:glycosyltransferase involved in cell wall biosynthesis
VKILLVHNKYQQPGGEDVVFEQERKLLEAAGHKVAVYCRTNDEISGYSAVQRLQLIKNTISSEASRREVLQLLRREEPHVVHIHNTFMMISPSVYPACREAGVPVVQTLHNYRLLCPAANFFRDGQVCEECQDHSLWRSVQHGCYRGSRPATATVALMLTVHRQRHTWQDGVDRFIALSEFARSKFIAGGLPGDRIGVKPNFVEPDPGERTNGGGYAAFVGRLSEEKGLETLVAAWARLGNRIPLVLVGDGPVGDSIKKQAQERGITSIDFRGRLPRAEAQAIVKGSSFLVLPSECYENFPMGMVESFACGVPVICSRLGALQELVDDGRTGLHFTPGSPEELAGKVEWAWSHPERLREMGKEARRDFQLRYTAEKNYSMLMDIYKSVIAQPQEVTA